VSYFLKFAGRFAVLLHELEGQKVVVIGHQRPDGDCIGSQVALCRVLNSLGIDTVCMNPDPVPRRIKFLLGDTPFYRRDELPAGERAAIFTDCADHARAGDKVKAQYPSPMACFDHHVSNGGFAKRNFVDTGSAATAEILAGMFFDADMEVDAITAQALYTGIMTDTGQFRFPSTTHRVFKICGELVARGANPAQAGMELFERETSGKLKLLQHYISSLKFECAGRACIGVLPQGIFEEVDATVEDTEGLVDYARSIEGVEIGVLIEERPGTIKASLRAKSAAYRVDTIAAQFNGGGHASAAGLNCPDTLAAFYPKLVAAITRRLVEVDTAKK
jgi:phosphoesterase RecJ-like protein